MFSALTAFGPKASRERAEMSADDFKIDLRTISKGMKPGDSPASSCQSIDLAGVLVTLVYVLGLFLAVLLQIAGIL